jgi:uncharacterized protein (TIGR00251 family)
MKTKNFRLSVKVLPSSSRDVIVGWLGEALKIKVRAPAEKGRANKAVEKVIANLLGISMRSVSVVSGHTTALKIIEISDISEPDGLKLLPARWE